MTRDFVPHDEQLPAIEHLVSSKRCGLWMPMGGGKSVTTLTALEQLDAVEQVYPALVLGPKRVIEITWLDEVAKWAHTAHLRVVVVSGSRRERELALRRPADLYCMAYDNLEWLVDHVGGDWPFPTVVADELTKLKGFRLRQGGRRAGALGKVAHSKVQRFIGLTGTPAPNGIKDLWGQTYFIDKGERLGKTFSAFEQRWFRKGYDGYSLVPYDHSQTEVMGAISDIYLTVKSLQVDDPITVVVPVKLPPAVRAAYDAVEKELFAEIEVAGFGALEIEAANAAVRLGKCLAEGTEILTDGGWKPIERYEVTDRLWDGVEWVSACNLVCQGHKPVVDCWGVLMTPDHKVLTTEGWREAAEIVNGQSAKRPYRPDIRLPDDCSEGGEPDNERDKCQSDLVRGLRLWAPHRNNRREYPVGQSWGEKVLRLPQGRNACRSLGHARHDAPPGVGGVVQDAVPLRKPERQGLAKLRSARDKGLRCLAAIFGVLGGYGSDVFARRDLGADGQQRGVHSRKLPLAVAEAASQQQAGERPHSDAHGAADCGASGAAVRCPGANDLLKNTAGVAGRHASSSALVYDIVNAGPRHRFTVRGRDGNAFIAHNCLQIASGAVFEEGGATWQKLHDAKLDALESIVEEANGMPVLVSYAYTHDAERILKRFKQARMLDGPETIRAWNAGKIPVLVAHPASAGHGLNLQDGGNILAFFGLTFNLEHYMQIIERIGPLRQKQSGYDRPVYLYHIVAEDTFDQVALDRLAGKRSVQDAVLEYMETRK